MGLAVDEDIERAMMAADEIGVRLEIVSGVPYWEFQPGFRHQEVIFQIAKTISRGKSDGDCACICVLDVAVRFPDGSVKRPDLSIFCRVPDEKYGLVKLIPEAVVEIISPGYETKDLEIGPSFYLAQGVKDVVVHDPRTGHTVHFRKDKAGPIDPKLPIELLCGCVVQIPANS